MEKEKKYRVVWDQKYCNNCHDEYLTDVLSIDEAHDFAEHWAEKKVEEAFPSIDKLRDFDFFERMVRAKMSELSCEPVFEESEAEEALDKVEVNLTYYLQSNIENLIRNLISNSETSLSNGWGNKDVLEKQIRDGKTFLKACELAKKNKLGKIQIVFEKE